MFGLDLTKIPQQLDEFQALFAKAVATMQEMRDEVKDVRAELAEARKEIAALKEGK